MTRKAELTKAVAYLRTSSAANIGADKDSDRRQRDAIQAFARRAGFEVVDEFYDPAVSGGDPVETRPGFMAMLKRIESNGVRTIIVETASRFARDLMVQEVGYAMLTERGIELIAADSPQSFIEDTPTARLIRQVLGAVSEFDKAITVAKLKGARDRKRATGVKVEGRRSYVEAVPMVVAEAKRLRRKRPKGGQRSLREIAAELARAGYTTSTGKPYGAPAIRIMVGEAVGGKAPFGFRRDKKGNLVHHQPEQEALFDASMRRARGDPLTAIAADLQARGHRVGPDALGRALGDLGGRSYAVAWKEGRREATAEIANLRNLS